MAITESALPEGTVIWLVRSPKCHAAANLDHGGGWLADIVKPHHLRCGLSIAADIFDNVSLLWGVIFDRRPCPTRATWSGAIIRCLRRTSPLSPKHTKARLGYALQLCCLRDPGRYLRQGETLPTLA